VQEDLKLDNNYAKNFFGHVTGNLASWFRLGAMGYTGRESGAVAGGPEVTNQLWMLGADATFTVGTFEINAQYIHREDSYPTFSPTDEIAKTDGGFAEVIWQPRESRWYALALYNRIDCNQPLLNVRLGVPTELERYQTVTGGLGWIWRRNVRVMGEASWDLEREVVRWTLGLVTAF
jgi:hypothetical protein